MNSSLRWLLGGLVFYSAALIALACNQESSLGDALALLVIFGIGFPFLAWFGTRWAKPLQVEARITGTEMVVLLAYCLALSFYLAFGPQAIDALLPPAWVQSPPLHEIITLVKKLIAFVALPLVLFCYAFGHRPKDFGFQREAWRELVRSHALVILLVGGSALAFNLFLGNGAAPIRQGALSSRQLCLGLPLCFLWLTLEVGLVEEFFFRALLQSRLSAWLGSETAGIVLMSFLFGWPTRPESYSGRAE